MRNTELIILALLIFANKISAFKVKCITDNEIRELQVTALQAGKKCAMYEVTDEYYQIYSHWMHGTSVQEMINQFNGFVILSNDEFEKLKKIGDPDELTSYKEKAQFIWSKPNQFRFSEQKDRKEQYEQAEKLFHKLEGLLKAGSKPSKVVSIKHKFEALMEQQK